MTFPIKITLHTPVESFGADIYELNVNRSPTLNDLIEAEALEDIDASKRVRPAGVNAMATDAGTTMHAFARCCGVTPSTMRSLSLIDWTEVKAAFAPFVSRPTGETPPSS